MLSVDSSSTEYGDTYVGISFNRTKIDRLSWLIAFALLPALIQLRVFSVSYAAKCNTINQP